MGPGGIFGECGPEGWPASFLLAVHTVLPDVMHTGNESTEAGGLADAVHQAEEDW